MSPPARAASSASPHSIDSGAGKRNKACAYCFRRKIKCDLLIPCSNCLARGEVCSTSDRQDRPRPTYEKIDQLQAEVKRLEELLAKSQSFAPIGNLAPNSPSIGLDESDSRATFDVYAVEVDSEIGAGECIRSRLGYGRSGVPTAHGPTSAFFDDLPERVPAQSPHKTSALDDATVKLYEMQATAVAAWERHMETVNLNLGKLDFDGVAPDLAMHLLGLHWNRQHYAFMISYRPLFTRDMACDGPYFSKLLLNAIYFSVSKFSNRSEVYDNPLDQTTAGQCFIRRIQELLAKALVRSSIPTIQAMLLLSSSLFGLGQQSTAWVYSGIAMRMITDMGLNYPTVQPLHPSEIEIQTRVVWAAFIYDKIIALYQGRAVGLRGEHMHVAPRFFDLFEEEEHWLPYAFESLNQYSGAPARAISTFSAYCQLAVIMDQIITHIYADESARHSPKHHLRRLSANLEGWRKGLPAVIDYDPLTDASSPPPHVLSLHSDIAPPTFCRGHLHRADPPQTSVCWAKCEAAATTFTGLLTKYQNTFSLTRTPYIISYTTYVASTIHVRIAAQQGSQSESRRHLGICLEALEMNATTNPGVRKMLDVLHALMLKMNVSSRGYSNALENQAAGALFGLDLSAIVESFNSDRSSNLNFFDAMKTGNGGSGASFGRFAPNEGQSADNLYGFFNFQ